MYVQFPYIPTLNDKWEIPTSASPQKSTKFVVCFNRQLFSEKEVWFSLWATQKLSKPQHAQQMHDMFVRQMTRVIFVVLWSVPVQWNDNRGLFEDFYAKQSGLWQKAELYQSFDLYKANYLASHCILAI